MAVLSLYGDRSRARVSTPTTISQTEERGIALPQLEVLQKHIERRCAREGWKSYKDNTTLGSYCECIERVA